MRVRGLSIAAVVLVALSGVVYWSNRQKPKEPEAAKDAAPKILTLNEADIQKIEIKKKDQDVVVQRKPGGWELTSPQTLRADADAVGSMLNTLASLTSDRLVEDKPADLGQYGLAQPTTQVAVTSKDGKTHTVLLGDDAPTGGSTFVKLAGDPRVFTVPSYTKTNLDKNPRDLRDKRLLTFEEDKVTRLEVAGSKQAIEFGRNGQNEWQILKPAPMRADNFQVGELMRKLKDAHLDEADSKQFAGAVPVATVKVTDASGTQQLQVRKAKDNNYYAKSSVVEGVQKLAADLGSSLDKPVDEFRNKKLFDFGFNEPNKIEMHDAGKSYLFQRSGENWVSGGKPLDNTSVQSFLDKLRELAATKFSQGAFGTPTIDITVSSNDGKRTEKVLISGSLAKRENEPTLYELDPKSVQELQRGASDVKPASAAKK